jgi:nitrous oxide reductase
MANQKTKTSRRDFLRAAGVTGAAAGAAAVALSGKRVEAAASDERKQGAYRETEHVRTYYELARF